MAPVSRIHVWTPAFAAGLVVVLWAVPAQATEMDDFQRAQTAYQSHEYEQAVRLFEEMIVPVPAIQDRLLIQESRKYLGAAYLFVGRRPEAERQFEAFLRDEDDFESYQLDPALFPSDVISVFRTVRERLVEELADQADRDRERAEQREERRRQALLSLVSLAQESEVELENDLRLAWVPFGAGQFQNGNEDLGWFFAIAEGLTLVASAVSLSTFLYLETEHLAAIRDPMEGRATPPETRQTLFGASIASSALFVGLAVAGILEAHIEFRPRRTVRQPREIPPEVLQELDLAVGPGSVSLRLRF